MWHRVTQRILQCAICESIPDDGEYLWEMSGEYWCRRCCEDIESRLNGDDEGVSDE